MSGLWAWVVHPGLIVAPRTEYDEHTGVVHHYQEVLAGETMPGGAHHPVMAGRGAGPADVGLLRGSHTTW